MSVVDSSRHGSERFSDGYGNGRTIGFVSSSKNIASSVSSRQRLGRACLLLFGIACLVTGIWGGLLRVPIILPLPVDHANWISYHGPLMVCGFLGTLIPLERAVGLRETWTYSAPIMVGVAGVALAAGVLAAWPRLLLLAGSCVYVAVSVRVLVLQPALPNVVMGLGALSWTVGNGLWLYGSSVAQVVMWWLSFLLLTILGERIELTRFQKQTRSQRPWLAVALVAVGAGLVWSLAAPRPGGVLLGLAIVVISLWLFRFDLAWRTIRSTGLPRFMAVCLLSGYCWLALTGVLVAWRWPQSSGTYYDAALHAFFVGFVFAMIFGHAPVIFPAVLGVPIHFYWTSYIPLVVLHASVLMRAGSDLAEWNNGRVIGALGNALAVGLFLVNNLLVIAGVFRARNHPAKPRNEAAQSL